jgi:hypothetical protein
MRDFLFVLLPIGCASLDVIRFFLALDIQHWSFCPSALDPDRYALFIFGAGHSMLLT